MTSIPKLVKVLEQAYISLLRLPVSERISRQRDLIALRDALAEANQWSDEHTQNHYTALALAWEGKEVQNAKRIQ